MTAAQPSPSTRSPRLSPNSAFALRPLRLSVILRRVFATPALTLAPSTSCGLFVVAKKINSFAIKQIQTLLQKHPGWGYLSTSTPPFDSAVVCATWRLYPMCPHSIAHTSRHHGGEPPTPLRFLE